MQLHLQLLAKTRDPLTRLQLKCTNGWKAERPAYPGTTTVPWNFTTFPSQTFKDDFGAALLEYANGNMSFDKVEKQVVDEWASEKGAN